MHHRVQPVTMDHLVYAVQSDITRRGVPTPALDAQQGHTLHQRAQQMGVHVSAALLVTTVQLVHPFAQVALEVTIREAIARVAILGTPLYRPFISSHFPYRENLLLLYSPAGYYTAAIASNCGSGWSR